MPTRSASTEAAKNARLAARIGEAIAEQRRARGLTQAKLAELLYLEQEAVSRWERGSRAPTLYRLQQLSDVLGCSVDRLLHRGSKRADDQVAAVANALKDLDADERALVLNLVHELTDFLRTKRSRSSRK